MKKVLVIGSGPIVIGQAAEFDYAGTQACLSLKEEGIHVVLVNNNPATIMTDPEIADTLYMEPLDARVLEDIIAKERPDGLMASLGGQTGLNLASALEASGVLKTYGVKLLGTSVEAIRQAEDRALFRSLMMELSLPVVASKTVETVEEGLAFAAEIGYPLILRPAFTLGGEGGGMVTDGRTLREKLERALNRSPIHQVLVEKSIHGWKEIEYELMRDGSGDTIIVTTMENIDPVGVHTGDSAVVAPMLTVSDDMRQKLDDAAHNIARALGLIGGANVQFAVHPEEEQFYVIEVNPRVSRSSALASKATGYPIAYATAKVALGYRLAELHHPLVPGKTLLDAPQIAHYVVKLPRFAFDVFPEADTTLGTQMQATGEVMGLGKTVQQAFNKALRALDLDRLVYDAASLAKRSQSWIIDTLKTPRADRLVALFAAFYRGMTVAEVARLTSIHPYFLTMIQELAELNVHLMQEATYSKTSGQLLKAMHGSGSFDRRWLLLFSEVKHKGIGDRVVAHHLGIEEEALRRMRQKVGLTPTFFVLDPYGDPARPPLPKVFFSAYDAASLTDDAGVNDWIEAPDRTEKQAIVLGSGAIRIGQGIEFDYASVHALLALKAEGFQTIVINHNPETVSTDFSVADRLYMEPLALEDVLDVVLHEQGGKIMLAYGGQSALNLAEPLQRYLLHDPSCAHIKVRFDLSTGIIATCEARQPFYELLDALSIPHPVGYSVNSRDMLKTLLSTLGFPLVIRPSYVIGGMSMMIVRDAHQLEDALNGALGEQLARGETLLVDRYIDGLEFEADLLSDGQDIYIPAFFEHVEPAGIHSGDSIAKFPAQSLTPAVQAQARDYAERIARALDVKGLLNIQYIAQGETVYVLEVNPRASRTVPIVGKLIGRSMVKGAVQCLLGQHRLKDLDFPELHEKRRPVAIKAPVFSTEKLSQADPRLGPLMRSTGEVLAVSWHESDALYRALVERRAPLLADLDAQPNIAYYGTITSHDTFFLFKRMMEAGAHLFLPASAQTDWEDVAHFATLPSDTLTFYEEDVVYDDPSWWRGLQLLIAPHLKDEGQHAQYFRRRALYYGVPVISCLKTAELMPLLRRTDGVETLQTYSQALLDHRKRVPSKR